MTLSINITRILTFRLIIVSTILFSINCYSQDTCKQDKILIVERTIVKDSIPKTRQVKFKVNKRVTIETFSHDTLLRGKIKSLNDSCITIKDQTVYLKNICRINKHKGVDIIFKRLSVVAFTATALSLSVYQMTDDDTEDREEMPMIIGIIIGVYGGGLVVIESVIEMLTTKTYQVDKGWKFYVTDNKSEK